MKGKPKISTPMDIIRLRKSVRACGIDYFTLEKQEDSGPVMFEANGSRTDMNRVCAVLENLGYSVGSSLVHNNGLYFLSVHVRCKYAFIGPHELSQSLYLEPGESQED